MCLARCGLKNALINYYSMRIDILSSKLELTSALSDYIEKKLQKLEKFLKRFPQESVTIKAELGKPTIMKKVLFSGQKAVLRYRTPLFMLMQYKKIYMPPLTKLPMN